MVIPALPVLSVIRSGNTKCCLVSSELVRLGNKSVNQIALF